MESFDSRPGHLTAHQVAHVLGVGLPAVRKLVQRGKLTRSGGTDRQPWYAAADVAAYIAARAPRQSA